jgi:hypothetical protein
VTRMFAAMAGLGALGLIVAACSTEEADNPSERAETAGNRPRVRLAVAEPRNRLRTYRDEITVSGRVTKRASVSIEGDDADVSNGRFSAPVALKVGRNRIQIVGRRKGYVTGRQTLTVVRRQKPVPTPVATSTPEPTPEPRPEAPCDPNYAGACLDPNSADYDCEGGSGDGPDYTGTVRVIGGDPYDLDRDGDGIACDT